MTKLYLIRHAEAEGNLYRIAQGQDNSNLTDRGWRQVRALERRFADIHIDAVYSSDLYRTCATASAVYKPKSLPLHRVPALREIGVGIWERRTWGDIYRRWPEQMAQFSQQPHLWQMEGAETVYQVLDRVLAAVREIAKTHEGETVALFSHGYAIRMLLTHLEGLPLEEAGRFATGDNTAVSLLEAEGDTLRIVFRDDNSHLTTPEFLSQERCVVKRHTALEPGLWFAPLRLPEQAEFLRSLAAEGNFDPEPLVENAAGQDTLVGYLREAPIGFVQMGEEPGEIAFVCIREDGRNRGFGIQLIGQAVLHARERGAKTLRVGLAKDHAAGQFFEDHGFVPVEQAEDGRVILEKDICLLPEFLGE